MTARRRPGRRAERARRHTHPSTVVLLASVKIQVRRLITGEIALLKTAASLRAARLGMGAGLLGGSALLAFFFVAALIAFGLVSLAGPLPLWLAALMIVVLLLLIALLFALAGARQVQSSAKPEPLKGDLR